MKRPKAEFHTRLWQRELRKWLGRMVAPIGPAGMIKDGDWIPEVAVQDGKIAAGTLEPRTLRNVAP